MKKNYNKPIIEVEDISSSTVIALELSTGNKGVVDFIGNPGDSTGWTDLFD